MNKCRKGGVLDSEVDPLFLHGVGTKKGEMERKEKRQKQTCKALHSIQRLFVLLLLPGPRYVDVVSAINGTTSK